MKTALPVRRPGQQQLKPAAPFAAAAFLALAVFPTMKGGDTTLLPIAGGLTVAIAVAALATPWAWLPPWAAAIPAFAYFPVVALLRDAQDGAHSPFAILVLLPVFWLALHGTPRQLAWSIAASAATLALPQITSGGASYPPSEWGRVALVTLIAALIGATVQGLVGEVRRRESELLIAARVARDLSHGTDSRQSVCRATVQAAGACAAWLLQPDEAGRLVQTASAGSDIRPSPIWIDDPRSPSAAAFRSGQAVFVEDVRSDPRVNALTPETLSIVSLLCEPVTQRDETVGVLAVAWPERVRGPQSHGVRTTNLLAIEAALAIERAHTFGLLESEALTDVLTSLPNRRAWEEELPRQMARASREGTPLCVAVIDLDRFKVFNDTHGHVAGDRLLQETAARWRRRLRLGDFLARYGGEEFVLALPDCDLVAAERLWERLRKATPEGQTCSAGIAAWDGLENQEALLQRADTALYAAKQAGRDRAMVG